MRLCSFLTLNMALSCVTDRNIYPCSIKLATPSKLWFTKLKRWGNKSWNADICFCFSGISFSFFFFLKTLHSDWIIKDNTAGALKHNTPVHVSSKHNRLRLVGCVKRWRTDGNIKTRLPAVSKVSGKKVLWKQTVTFTPGPGRKL